MERHADTEMLVMKEQLLLLLLFFIYSQIPRSRKHSIAHRAIGGSSRVSQEAKGVGESMIKSFYCDFYRKN